ncbi:serine hydrolase [Reticulibacter mediterranei]|uniref:Serine hydrolase n=1 Tax=Reticulibacter mediterranei TaxID=2778369 RepID=A0A8J3IKJ6_9CHLR|nr:serine hydrolase domain-containing protein [Reticulibacter mediterranei]GHO96191.1 serine hydrolase [Reticulibacter mediterranei]
MINETSLTLALEQVEKEHCLSGALLISQDGHIVFEKAYGFANRQLNIPNVIETKFHIASVTKMFIAMAALVLSEHGQISLQEKPYRYLPELVVLDQNITLHHLLSHTSGLQDIYDVPNLRFEMQKLKNERGSLLSYLVKLPQLFQAGEGWSYSSTGFILMGYLLERVTGLSFDELMKRYVLAPLDMTDTGLDRPRWINFGRAYGHTVEDGEVVHADNDRLSLFEEAPGELYSTVLDLNKWCDALFACPLVSPHTLQLMFTPHGQGTAWGRSWQYGYGWFLGPGFRMHGGGTQGFCSLIRQYPAQKVSIIVLLNSDHMEVGPIISAVEPLLLN